MRTTPSSQNRRTLLMQASPRAAGLWRQVFMAALLTICGPLAFSGCQTAMPASPDVCFTPHTIAEPQQLARPTGAMPPSPSPSYAARNRLMQSALNEQQSFVSPTMPSPASASPVGVAASCTNLAPGPLAPADTSGARSVTPPLSSPAAAAMTKALAATEASSEAAFESRLAALEQQWQDKLAALDEVQARYHTQTEELAQVRTTLENSRQELQRLETTVGTQHQRDVESLEELSHTLEQLLDTETAATSTEAP